MTEILGGVLMALGGTGMLATSLGTFAPRTAIDRARALLGNTDDALPAVPAEMTELLELLD